MKNFVDLGHGKKIHCFSGKTFPTLEAVGRFFFFIINSVGKSPGNHKQEYKSVASYPVFHRGCRRLQR